MRNCLLPEVQVTFSAPLGAPFCAVCAVSDHCKLVVQVGFSGLSRSRGQKTMRSSHRQRSLCSATARKECRREQPAVTLSRCAMKMPKRVGGGAAGGAKFCCALVFQEKGTEPTEPVASPDSGATAADAVRKVKWKKLAAAELRHSGEMRMNKLQRRVLKAAGLQSSSKAKTCFLHRIQSSSQFVVGGGVARLS